MADDFQAGLWLKTSIAVWMLSEDNYRRYMRGFGVLLIVVGGVLILIGAMDG